MKIRASIEEPKERRSILVLIELTMLILVAFIIIVSNTPVPNWNGTCPIGTVGLKG